MHYHGASNRTDGLLARRSRRFSIGVRRSASGSGYAFLRDEVFPRRQNMLAIAGPDRRINEQQLTAGNEQAVSAAARFQTRLRLTLFAALALGLGMAAFQHPQFVRLEDQARRVTRKSAEARSQLKDLSARLVQAQETERRALSRELHDEVGQSLSAVLVELRNLSLPDWTIGPKNSCNRHVETIEDLVEGTDSRGPQHGAAAAAVDAGRSGADSGAEMAGSRGFEAHLDGCQRRSRARLRRSLRTNTKPAFIAWCRRRCTIAPAIRRRPASASASQQKAGRLTLTIQDDGQGFDSQQVKGLGLLGIQERVARLGGKCEVHSEPGTGTTLAVELPLVDRRIVANADDAKEAREPDETDSHPVS